MQIGRWISGLLAAWFTYYLGNAWWSGTMTLGSRYSSAVREITLSQNLGEFIGLSVFFGAMIGLMLIVVLPDSRPEKCQPKKQREIGEAEIEKIKKAYRRS